MIFFITKCMFLFTIIFGTLDGIDCQLAAIATRLPEIITLLENVTDSSATMSSFLPQLATLLQNQDDVQMLTNVLLKNNTSTADEVASILPAIKEILQDQHGRENQVVTLLEDQQQNHNQTTTLLQNQQDAVNRIESTLVQMVNTQAQMANTQAQMANTQAQVANTQTQMVNTFDQMVSLLQTQSHQLENMTAKLTSILNVQNDILQLQLPKDCSDICAPGTSTSGPYIITPQDGLGSIRVYCDMDTDGAGWTVFQRRFDGSVDFYRGWNDYERGFGSADGEYWLGLRHIRRLTQTRSWTLRIHLEAFDGSTAYAEYESFQVGDAASNYTLSFGTYHGTVYDALTYHNNQAFTTKDRDHDTGSEFNCAQQFQGAWWYANCLNSNLNGLYPGLTHTGTYHPETISWKNWPGSAYIQLKGSEMMIRPSQ